MEVLEIVMEELPFHPVGNPFQTTIVPEADALTQGPVVFII